MKPVQTEIDPVDSNEGRLLGRINFLRLKEAIRIIPEDFPPVMGQLAFRIWLMGAIAYRGCDPEFDGCEFWIFGIYFGGLVPDAIRLPEM